MSSISDRLKALGVQLGANNLSAPRKSSYPALEDMLDGQLIKNRFGDSFVIEAFYGPDYKHGTNTLTPTKHLKIFSKWAGDDRIVNLDPTSFVFLDTETTGLSGGTGTYAFLIGVGRFADGKFHLAQYFMRDPSEEPAQLYALEEFTASSEAIVTYNGKAFDIPLLTTRYIAQGWKSPFADQSHLDLLHIARRLWRDRLPSRTLGNIEYQILGATRTEEDVPGWLIPQIYFDYLRSGDASPLKSVFYHNAMDILSLASLFTHVSDMLEAPIDTTHYHAVDIISLGKFFESIGDIDRAMELYLLGLDMDLPDSSLLEAILRLAYIHKKREDYAKASTLWEKAASHQHIDSHIELAKIFEHRMRNYKEALYWTQSAIELVQSLTSSTYEKNRWLGLLEHREKRLKRKQKHTSVNDAV